jgi:hypothetical protein
MAELKTKAFHVPAEKEKFEAETRAVNQSIWLNWYKNDQEERTYDHTGSSHSALPPEVGLSFTGLSDGITIQAANDQNTGVIPYILYINTWKSTVARYCSLWRFDRKPPATTRWSHPMRKRTAKTEWVNRNNQAKKDYADWPADMEVDAQTMS